MSIISNEHEDGSPFEQPCSLSIGDPDAEGRMCGQPARFHVDELPVCSMHADELLREDEYEHEIAVFSERDSDRNAVCIVQKVTVGWRWKVELTQLRTYEMAWGWFERDDWRTAIALVAAYLGRGWGQVR